MVFDLEPSGWGLEHFTEVQRTAKTAWREPLAAGESQFRAHTRMALALTNSTAPCPLAAPEQEQKEREAPATHP